MQRALRIARDDVGEGAAAVDPEVPARHRRPPCPVPPDTQPRRRGTMQAQPVCALPRRLLGSRPDVDLDPHHRGDRRASSRAARACSPSSSAGGRPERSVAFTIAILSLGAKMAKADGLVRAAEVAAFREVFRIAPEDEAAAARVFNLARQDMAGFEAYAARIAGMFRDQPRVLEDILEGLFHMALADGRYHEGEEEFLERRRPQLRGRAGGLRRDRGAASRGAARGSLAVLGLPRDADLADRAGALARSGPRASPGQDDRPRPAAETVNLGNARLAQINLAWEEVSARLREAQAVG